LGAVKAMPREEHQLFPRLAPNQQVTPGFPWKEAPDVAHSRKVSCLELPFVISIIPYTNSLVWMVEFPTQVAASRRMEHGDNTN
jgi:hypothetical protein